MRGGADEQVVERSVTMRTHHDIVGAAGFRLLEDERGRGAGECLVSTDKSGVSYFCCIAESCVAAVFSLTETISSMFSIAMP